MTETFRTLALGFILLVAMSSRLHARSLQEINYNCMPLLTHLNRIGLTSGQFSGCASAKYLLQYQDRAPLVRIKLSYTGVVNPSTDFYRYLGEESSRYLRSSSSTDGIAPGSVLTLMVVSVLANDELVLGSTTVDVTNGKVLEIRDATGKDLVDTVSGDNISPNVHARSGAELVGPFGVLALILAFLAITQYKPRGSHRSHFCLCCGAHLPRKKGLTCVLCGVYRPLLADAASTAKWDCA